MNWWWTADKQLMNWWWTADEQLVWSGLPKTITDYHRLPLTDWFYSIEHSKLSPGWMDTTTTTYIPDSTNYKSTASGANNSPKASPRVTRVQQLRKEATIKSNFGYMGLNLPSTSIFKFSNLVPSPGHQLAEGGCGHKIRLCKGLTRGTLMRRNPLPPQKVDKKTWNFIWGVWHDPWMIYMASEVI